MTLKGPTQQEESFWERFVRSFKWSVNNQACKVVTLQWAFGSNLHDLEKLCEKSYEKLWEKLYKKLYALL